MLNKILKKNLAKSAPPRHLNIIHVPLLPYREMYYYSLRSSRGKLLVLITCQNPIVLMVAIG